MKYFRTHAAFALLSAGITAIIVMFELLFLQGGQGDIWAEVCGKPKFYGLLAASYFGVFALGYIIALACVEFAEKIFRKWILSYIFGFAAYFFIVGIFLYAASRAGSPQAHEAGILEFFKNLVRFEFVMSLQTFTIAFAFMRIAKKKLRSTAGE